MPGGAVEGEQRLVVVGGGAKAAAIAAKTAVLDSMGYQSPSVTVVEPNGVGSSWFGEDGLTDGKPLLCTPPERDLAFPYPETWGDDSGRVDEIMLGRFSWQAFMNRANQYCEYVDRGMPHPTHGGWGEYLLDAFEQALLLAPTKVTLKRGYVRGLDIEAGRWTVRVERPDGGTTKIRADGVVATGTGAAARLPGQPKEDPRIADGRTFWRTEWTFDGKPAKIAVIGSGGGAAAICRRLLETLPPNSSVTSINKDGMLFSRGESYHENRPFTNPGSVEWREKPIGSRQRIISRTNKGVVSSQLQRILGADGPVAFVPHAGAATRLEITLDGDVAVHTAPDGHDRKARLLKFDRVAVAIGFDDFWFLDLVGAGAEGHRSALWGMQGGSQLDLIDEDLSLSGCTPPLHVPMLSALAQGPGFPGLQCLGLTADRILKPYVERARAA